MTFPEALAAAFNSNARITRRAWNNPRAQLRVDSSGRLCTTWNDSSSTVDGLLHPLIITTEDYFSMDWEVVE